MTQIKQPSLSDKEIVEIENRILKGWVVRRDEWTALVAMAKAHNAVMRDMAALVAEKAAKQQVLGGL